MGFELQIGKACTHVAFNGNFQNSLEEDHDLAAKSPDYMSFAMVGLILVIIAITIIRYQVDPYLIIEYFDEILRKETFLKPPLVLLHAAIFFFWAIGLGTIVVSALRLTIQRNIARFIGGCIGGMVSFLLAILATNFASDFISSNSMVAYSLLSIGFLVIINAVVDLVFRRKQ